MAVSESVRRAPDRPDAADEKVGCIVVHNYFPLDPRVRREVEALLSDGWSLDIVCLREANEPRFENWNGARVHRLPVRRHRGSGMAVYLLEYAQFFMLATLYLTGLRLRRRYQLVQAHNVPDFLAFAAAPMRFSGARVLLDIRDPLPDLYASKYGGNQNHTMVKAVRWVEAVSTAFADHVLTPGEPSRRRLLGRNVPSQKVTNVLNSADPSLFAPLPPKARIAGQDQHFTLVYHGGLFARYGLDIAIRAVGRLRHVIPELRLRIAGYGEEEENLQRLVVELGLQEHVVFEGWVDPADIPRFVADADLGVVPYRHDIFTDLIYPTKAFECIAMGVPVIMSSLAGVVELFPNVPDLLFPPDDDEALAEHIRQLYLNPARLQRLTEATKAAYAPYAWEGQRQVYLTVVQQLVNRG